MADPFSDLIPGAQREPAQAAANPFADLIPDNGPALSLSVKPTPANADLGDLLPTAPVVAPDPLDAHAMQASIGDVPGALGRHFVGGGGTLLDAFAGAEQLLQEHPALMGIYGLLPHSKDATAATIQAVRDYAQNAHQFAGNVSDEKTLGGKVAAVAGESIPSLAAALAAPELEAGSITAEAAPTLSKIPGLLKVARTVAEQSPRAAALTAVQAAANPNEMPEDAARDLAINAVTFGVPGAVGSEPLTRATSGAVIGPAINTGATLASGQTPTLESNIFAALQGALGGGAAHTADHPTVAEAAHATVATEPRPQPSPEAPPSQPSAPPEARDVAAVERALRKAGVPQATIDAAKATARTEPIETEASVQPAGGGVPVMITQSMGAELRARGISDADIAKLTPQQARDVLAQPVTAPATENAAAPNSPTAGTSSPEQPIAPTTPAHLAEPIEIPDLAKPLHEMNGDELEAQQQSARDIGKQIEDKVLGDNAESWRMALRQRDSSDPAISARGERRLEEIESGLSEPERNALYGIGLPEHVFDEARDFSQAQSDAEVQSPGEASEVLARYLQRLSNTPEDSSPADWTREQQVAYSAIRRVQERIAEEGWNSRDIQKRAVTAVASRFRDPRDAEVMLGRFFKPQGTRKAEPATQRLQDDDTPEPPLEIRYGRPRDGAGVSGLLGDRSQPVSHESEPPATLEEPRELTDADLTPAEREAFQRQRNAQDDADLTASMRADSMRRGEQEAAQRGMPEAVQQALGDNARVRFVHDEDGLPENVQRRLKSLAEGNIRKGAFDPSTGDVYLFTKHVKDAADAVWTAAHEIAGHKGFRALVNDRAGVKVGGRTPTEALAKAHDMALQNPTVAKLADAIGEQRGSADRRTMAEEAMAELQAASVTGRWDEIGRRYGVDVPKGVREGVQGAIRNFVARIKRILNALYAKATGKPEPFTDEHVHAMLAQMREHAGMESRGEGAPLDSQEPSDDAVYRHARTFGQARAAAKEFLGRPLSNNSGLPDATVSRTNLDKMLSQSATAKSNTAADHALAVANLDHLYRIGLLDRAHADARNAPSIAKVHRVVAPMVGHDGGVRAVKMTVKETVGAHQPNPLYTVETLDVAKPDLEAPREAGLSGSPDLHRNSPQAGFSENVSRMLEDFKRQHQQPKNNEPSGIPGAAAAKRPAGTPALSEGSGASISPPDSVLDSAVPADAFDAGKLEEQPKPVELPARAPGESQEAWHARVMREGRGDMQDGMKAFNADTRTLGRGVIRATLADVHQRIAKAARAFDAAQAVFDKAGKDVNLKAIDQWERGEEVTSAAHRLFFKAMQEQFDQRIEAIRQINPAAMKDLIANYFPHLWENPKKAGGVIAGIMQKRNLTGDKSFLKQRYWPTIKEGMASGLKPVSTNPVDLVLGKLAQMDKFIAMSRMMQDMDGRGWIKKIPAGEQRPEGYAFVDDPAFRSQHAVIVKGGEGEPDTARALHWNYAVPEAVAKDINRYLSPGLYQFKGWRAFRGVQNFLLSARLGFSAFHAGFTTADTLVSHLDVAMRRASSGDVTGAAETLARTVASPILAPLEGRKLFKQFYGEAATDEHTAAVLNALKEGGARGLMNPTDENNSFKKVLRAARQGRLFKTALHALPATVEATTRLISHHLVPYQKMAARALLMKYELDRVAPQLGKDKGDYAGIVAAMNPDALRQIAGRVVQNVDDRLGQMAYDNLFWPRMVKDIAQATIQSVGWNVGTFNTIVGAAGDVKHIFKPERLVAPLDKAGTIRDARLSRVSGRLSYLISLNIAIAALSGTTQYLLTGQWPQELKDYFYPRTGRKNPDGTDERLSWPTYLKDEYALATHPVQTVEHKVHPVLSMALELWNNEDFYGTKIHNPDDPWSVQATQIAKYLVGGFEPYAVQNQEHVAKAGGNVIDRALPFVGITPAPADVSRSPFESFLGEAAGKSSPSEARTPEQAAQTDAMHEAENAIRHGQEPDMRGLSPLQQRRVLKAAQQEVPQIRFKRLGIEDKLRAYDLATPAEREQYDLAGLILRGRWQESIQNLPEQDRAPVMAQMRKVREDYATRH